MGYKHLFFDLDHTLWDFERNSAETLKQLYDEFDLCNKLNCSSDEFIRAYARIIREMWDLYDRKKIDKTTLRNTRFTRVFKLFDVQDNKLAAEVNEEYLKICPRKPHLIPNALNVLQYLTPKYSMSLVTNGFKESQFLKIKHAGLTHFFQHIITSECSGHSKPDERMFFYALKKANVDPKDCLMIGDNAFSDIEGAKRVKMDQVYFNPRGEHKVEATFNINSLHLLKEIL